MSSRDFKGNTEARVLTFIRKRNLVHQGQKVLVAVSGGPDSMALVLILASLRQALGIDLHIAHLEHGLRGEQSKADAEYVRELAERLEIPAVVEARNVNAYRESRRTSTEEAAREVRYAFLAEAVDLTGCSAAVTGHTSDDNVETVLMHLVRGSGSRGLRGLRPSSILKTSYGSIEVIRPLLELNKDETLEYCRGCGVEPRIDASNNELVPLRNSIRHQLLPLLESYNPNIRSSLLRTAAITGDELDFLDEVIVQVYQQTIETREGVIIIDRNRLRNLSRAGQRLLLRKAIEKLLGNLRDIEYVHIDAMMAAAGKISGKKLDLPHGLVFSVEYDRCSLTSGARTICPFPSLGEVVPLKVPGKTDFAGWQVSATVLENDGDSAKFGMARFSACLDADRVTEDISVRARRRGDSFHPLGLGHEKKLGRFMIDARIPPDWRDRVPIVSSGDRILWVVGWRIDENMKVTPQTRRVLAIDFQLASGEELT